MLPPGLDPTQYTALHSLSLPNFLSPDGRAHVVGADTPVVLTQSPVTPDTTTVTDPTTGATAGTGVDTTHSGFFGMHLPPHFGARMAVGAVASILVAIVFFRLTADN